MATRTQITWNLRCMDATAPSSLMEQRVVNCMVIDNSRKVSLHKNYNKSATHMLV
jgi:hypothetical protein